MRAVARRTCTAIDVTVAVLALVAISTNAVAQVTGLYYQEVERDGRVYVFNTPERFKSFQASGEMGQAITSIGRGAQGETVVAENETALDLYLFKHGLPGYDRPTPKPAPPSPPTVLKVGDGEVRLGTLLQAWYVADDSPVGTGTGYLGNVTGNNTFRLRRAELKIAGKITPAWAFELMADFAKTQTFTTSGVSVTDDKLLQDVFIAYTGVKGHEFGIGQKKIVITDEALRSSSELDFVERARITRAFSDRREAGLFYRGELTEKVMAYLSLTNGTPSNVLDNSNDTLFGAARIDYKPAKGFILGLSGGTSGGETAAHLRRDLLGAHFRYDGPDTLPIGLRAEYLGGTFGQLGQGDLKQGGTYATVLYTIAKQYQLAVRYEELDRNKDAAGNKVKTLTAGFNWLLKGKNMNLKLDYFNTKEEGRKVNGALDETSNQVVLAAQITF